MNCLQRADEIVHGSRNETYGDPKQNHETTAALFSEFMRRRYGTFPELTPEDVCWFNICQKMSREAHCKTDDGLTDIAGYSANIEIVRKGWSISEGKAKTAHVKPPETQQIDDVHEADFASIPGDVLGWNGQSAHSTTQVDPGKNLKPVADPFIRCADCGNVWMDGCESRCACPPRPPAGSKYAAVSPLLPADVREESER